MKKLVEQYRCSKKEAYAFMDEQGFKGEVLIIAGGKQLEWIVKRPKRCRDDHGRWRRVAVWDKTTQRSGNLTVYYPITKG